MRTGRRLAGFVMLGLALCAGGCSAPEPGGTAVSPEAPTGEVLRVYTVNYPLRYFLGRASENGFALLLRDTSRDADHDGPRFLHRRKVTETRENFFLRFLPHTAGVENDDTGVHLRIGRLETEPYQAAG